MNCILNYQSAVMKQMRGMLTAIGLAAFLAMGLPLQLQAANPDFQNTSPRGAKRGTEVQVTFTGSRIDDAQEILFHQPGISFKDLKWAVDEKTKRGSLTATLVIAPDARLGEHQLRLRCKSGVTYARTFWVSQFDNVAEVEPNDSFEEPQTIPLNSTVTAAVKPEEVDFFKVQAKKGQRISVEIEGLRINNVRNRVAIDPYVAILDKDRFELAVSDDSALLKQESVISIVAPEDGEYVIEIRDASYQGSGRYRAHIGSFPRPLAIYPSGAKAGSETEFTLIGDPKGTYKAKAKMPVDLVDEHEVFGMHENLIPASGNKVRVSPFENVLEAEPNNKKEEATNAPHSLPLAFNGILEEPGDTDYFKFTAKKGERYRFKTYANRIGSPVDTVLYIYNEKGGSVGSNDDADGSKDSRVDFNCPADGVYFVRVKDMLDRGGKDFVYRVESEPYTPGILVTMPEMLRRDNQYRKQFNIPQGNNFAMVVNVSRQNLSGDLQFDLPKLPAGVTWEAGTIPKNLSQFPILLKAAPDAPVAGAMYDFQVKTVDAEKPVVGKYSQSIAFVRGNPNGTAYYTRSNDQLPIAVVEKAPFSISIDQPKVPIVRNGTMKLKIRANRLDGYDKKIVVRMLWRPPGISCPATMTFNEKDTELEYELNANANAEVNNWKITMLAESDGGKGQMVVAAPFVNLSVEEPYVGMKLNLTTVKQGQKTEMVANIDQLRDFEGEAQVQLFGLPAKAIAQTMKINKGTTELRFPISTELDTPVGQHKNMFCTLVLTKNGAPITHRVGMGGVLRVDPKPKEPAKPAPKPAADPKAVAAKAPAPKPEKPLSRLEQLRLEAKKAAEQK
ncbi:MAG: peptidase [Verrucomicrobiales bacterium]|nr:peptidase [Verrucomicrobiales bacterium]